MAAIASGSATRLRLIRAALPHIPRHGFTLAAIDAGRSEQAGEQDTSMQQDSDQYPFASGHEATRALLWAYDCSSLGASLSSEKTVESSTTSHNGQALLEAITRLDQKLKRSNLIRHHLVDALGVLAASIPSIDNADASIPPPSFMGRIIPSPRPLTLRAYDVASTALYTSQWRGQLHTDWYTTRARLSVAFLLAELRLLAPTEAKTTLDEIGASSIDLKDVHPPSLGGDENLAASLSILHTLAGTRDTTLSPSRDAKSAGTFPPLADWARWGTSGWLGIFRSLGL